MKLRIANLGKKRGFVLSGDKSPAWRGGVCQQGDGYLRIFSPTHPNSDARGYVYLHRLIAEQGLGRFLFKNEVAHHIDFDQTNNDPDNIVAMKYGDHIRYHQKITYLFEHLVGA